MLKGLNIVVDGVKELIFPHVCEICGTQLPRRSQFICQRCTQTGFEWARLPGEVNNPEILLPEGVNVQFALWRFDKGGFLQDLLHKLKYHRLYGVGEDLGRALGQRVEQAGFLNKVQEAVLIPVPLHKNKERKRGFNQAYYIAKGVGEVLNIPIAPERAIQRVKNTKTQTGFTLEKRKENISKAFVVTQAESVSGKTCIIVDDVYTTGATTFEMATELLNAGAFEVMIITVAEA